LGSTVKDNILDIEGVYLTPLNLIKLSDGDVMHGMKCNDPGYSGFGEAYFSIIEPGSIKAWKRHHEMVLNLIVPVGSVRFVIYDSRNKSKSYGKFREVTLSKENYYRLTIPRMLWMGFQGLGERAGMLLNIADIMHTPQEFDRKEKNEIQYNWEV
jgi:dTDP-4-dehydrorhamnose 3,5-epimerase